MVVVVCGCDDGRGGGCYDGFVFFFFFFCKAGCGCGWLLVFVGVVLYYFNEFVYIILI